MKKIWVIIIVVVFLTACSPTSKFAKDHEFDKSSKIGDIMISKENIEDLALLGKVWGYLKYYHPNIAKGENNWDYELFRVLPKIIDAKDPIERDLILKDWIESQGDFEIDKIMRVETEEIKLSPNLDWITNLDLDDELILLLLNIKDSKRADSNHYVSFDSSGSAAIFSNEKPYPKMEYSDVGYRLLSLYRYWNIIEYYFPYKYLIEENWDHVLTEFIPKFIDSQDELEYKLTVLELIARVKDTHANIYGDKTLDNRWGIRYAPLEVSFIEDKAVVTGYMNTELGEKTGVKVGDIITRINNKSIEDIVNERLKYIPASNYPTQLRNIAPDLLRTNDPYLDIELMQDEEIKSIEIECSPLWNIKSDKIPALDSYFKFVKPDIGYIYPGHIRTKYIPKIMEDTKSSKGLIIDLRCYPSEPIIYELGEYLFPNSTEFVRISLGSIREPGLFTIGMSLNVGIENENYYKGKVVIIINEMTQSQAEFTTMAFRASPNATVIGSTTAGADGNITRFYLPGNIPTVITGIGIYYPDGGETQRIGIIPDIEIRPTIEGIKEGKDELLEKAIEIIEGID